MFMLIAAVFALIGALLVSWGMAAWHRGTDPESRYWSRQLGNLQALLTISAVLLTGVWYFFERPTQAKLTIAQDGTGLRLPDGRVLVLAEVSIENVGDTAIDFKESPVEFYIQQVVPLPPAVAQEFAKPPAAGRPWPVRNADNWGVIAELGASGGAQEARLRSQIEAGETEQLYFRAVLPCKPGLKVYLNTRLEKPGGRGLKWTRHTLLDLGEQCS